MLSVAEHQAQAMQLFIILLVTCLCDLAHGFSNPVDNDNAFLQPRGAAKQGLRSLAQGHKDKCDVCRVRGNGDFETISISCKALPAYVKHGDFAVACEYVHCTTLCNHQPCMQDFLVTTDPHDCACVSPATSTVCGVGATCDFTSDECKCPPDKELGLDGNCVPICKGRCCDITSTSSFQPSDKGTLVAAVTDYIANSTAVEATYGPINTWNVAQIRDMSELFMGKTVFNADIGCWDVGSVTTMKRMFYNATAFNQDISGWNVGNVTTMNGMFNTAYAFNQDISSWNVGNVTTMIAMFASANAFNQDISGWNVENVTTMRFMFRRAAFNQDISGWNVGNVTIMAYMFAGTFVFNQDISGWNVGNVRMMNGMFYNAYAFNQNLCAWGDQLQTIDTVSNMFFGAWSCQSQTAPVLTADSSGPFCHTCTN